MRSRGQCRRSVSRTCAQPLSLYQVDRVDSAEGQAEAKEEARVFEKTNMEERVWAADPKGPER